MFNIDVCDAEKANDWNRLVNTVPNATVYHLWEWGDVLSQIYDYTKYYLTATRNGEIIGAFPLIHVRSRLFGNRLMSLPFCEYGGPITDPGLKEQEANEVTKLLLGTAGNLARRLHVEYIEIREVSSQVIENSVTGLRYNNLQRYMTFRVDLTRDLDEIWAFLHKDRTRKSIKKAIKSNVETKEIENQDQLVAYYALYLKTTRRLGSPPHKCELFEKLYSSFKPRGNVKILLAEYKGIPIGGIIVFCRDKTICDWNSVTDYEYRSLNSHNLLLWKIIEWGATNGYQTLDLGRTRKGTSIYDFKSGWGGVETKLSEYIYYLGPRKREPADTMQRKFRYLSKVWSFLPSSLASRIGPRIVGGIAL